MPCIQTADCNASPTESRSICLEKDNQPAHPYSWRLTFPHETYSHSLCLYQRLVTHHHLFGRPRFVALEIRCFCRTLFTPIRCSASLSNALLHPILEFDIPITAPNPVCVFWTRSSAGWRQTTTVGNARYFSVVTGCVWSGIYDRKHSGHKNINFDVSGVFEYKRKPFFFMCQISTKGYF